jgi:hypothetical protein
MTFLSALPRTLRTPSVSSASAQGLFFTLGFTSDFMSRSNDSSEENRKMNRIA